MLYAGVRPKRVRRLVSLEGFGMPRTTPDQAPARYAQWLDEVKHGSEFNVYENLEQFVRVLARRNPTTPPERLDFIARSWGQERGDGKIELRADPKHKRVNPVLYQRDQAEVCWRAIEAPLLFVMRRAIRAGQAHGRCAGAVAAAAAVSSRYVCPMKDAGHMLHHEQPEQAGRADREISRTAVSRSASEIPGEIINAAAVPPILAMGLAKSLAMAKKKAPAVAAAAGPERRVPSTSKLHLFARLNPSSIHRRRLQRPRAPHRPRRPLCSRSTPCRRS